MDKAQYDRTMSEVEKAIADGATRIDSLTTNVNRAIHILSVSHPKGLPAAEREVLLSFEALCVESLWRTAWMFHERGEHESAHQCLAVGKIVQKAVAEATRHD
jgi:hypothetical protein